MTKYLYAHSDQLIDRITSCHYFCAFEVETLFVDDAKATFDLFSIPQIALDGMVAYDLAKGRRHALMQRSGNAVSSAGGHK